MTERYFVTGTDTGAGKTLVAVGMLWAAAAEGKRTVGLKPIAAGAVPTADGLRNEDACLLAATMTEQLPYEHINPVVLQPAIAPHLALRESGLALDAVGLAERCAPALAQACDFMVVEGAGGWRVPLNGCETLADLARLFGFPVVLVVGMKLGCINHALLSAAAIRADGLHLAGWVANQIDPHQARAAENFATLAAMLEAPCIARVPWSESASAQFVAAHLSLDTLRQGKDGATLRAML